MVLLRASQAVLTTKNQKLSPHQKLNLGSAAKDFDRAFAAARKAGKKNLLGVANATTLNLSRPSTNL